jgi:hypothetical protein
MKIKQIIPATGWAAIYEENGKKSVAIPLVCWALEDRGVEELGVVSAVFGMISNGDGKIVEATKREGFVSYDYDYDAAVTDYLINNDGED